MDQAGVTGWWPADEHARLGVLERVLSDRWPLRGAVDLLAEAVATALDVPVALVSLVGRDRQFFLGQSGSPDAAYESVPMDHSFCRHVVGRGEKLVISETVGDPIVGDNPAIHAHGVRSYAGEPVVVQGQVLGSFCAFDFGPREWTDREVSALRAFADVVQYLVEARLTAGNQPPDPREGAPARDAARTARLAVYEALAPTPEADPSRSRGLQSALGPRPTSAAGLQVKVFHQTGADRLLLGGAFLDTLVDDRGALVFAIGEVAGHGPETAALAIGLRSAWRALATIGTDLAQTLAVLDRQALETGLTATMLLGSIGGSGRLHLVNAGHPDPIAVGAVGMQIETDPGPVLGLGHPAPRWTGTAYAVPGQTVIAYTDGLLTALGPSDDRSGVDGLLANLAEFGPDPATLCAAADAVRGGSPRVDVAILRIAPTP